LRFCDLPPCGGRHRPARFRNANFAEAIPGASECSDSSVQPGKFLLDPLTMCLQLVQYA
jgi:hypothetical protein